MAVAAAVAAWGVLLLHHLVGDLPGVLKVLLLLNMVAAWVCTDAIMGKMMLRGAAGAVAGQAHVIPFTHGESQGHGIFCRGRCASDSS